MFQTSNLIICIAMYCHLGPSLYVQYWHEKCFMLYGKIM